MRNVMDDAPLVQSPAAMEWNRRPDPHANPPFSLEFLPLLARPTASATG